MSRKFICTSDYPIAETADGKLKGFKLDGIITFHGIKYANAKRFQPATPVSKWAGVKDATNYGPVSPTFGETAPKGDMLIPHRYWPSDENCQYLNIWTTTMDQAAKKPVMVWLHGGGFADGSSIEQVAYSGGSLCKNGDVVVVTLNHRLNILGYLNLSAYDEKYKNSGNAGVTDLVEALYWVQRNITAFGGDPSNVTVFGQSGGGGKTYTLLQTPAAAGLFHKAIIMSGTDNFDRSLDHRPIISEMLKVLEIPENEVERLETIPYPILVKAYEYGSRQVQSAINWGPIQNDYFLGHPVDVRFSDFAKTVPTIVGTVIAEFGAFMKSDITVSSDESLKYNLIDRTFDGHGQEMIAEFKKAYPNTDLSVLLKLDTWVRQGALSFMDRRVKDMAEAPAYLYQFALVFDVNDGTPAWHCSDIPFIFSNTDLVANANIEGVTDRLEKEFLGFAISFAHTGDPNHKDITKWLPYTLENRETMVFDRETKLRTNFDSDLLKKMVQYLPKMKPFKMPVPEENDKYTSWFF